ncbi:Down syndrome cell adhesion molecule-like protein 1 homolog isoform X1 [Schistocerca piceifrons]|uniref:Down syndrome cell adhesion molecule-like protein 1 homolog isoform X1 n=1 Tax=Schistocerca piceifrons TaxID=274613 RepID=UPI001F5FDCC7|nr:Down syndrome cell adhesion molecule-like protein 1 homolog isoform X1 [Schistocerca piceifrons]
MVYMAPVRLVHSPATYIQIYTGKFLPQNHRQLVFPNGTLVIRDAKKEDEGGYLCVASNPDGLTSRSKLMVQVMEAPVIDRLYTKKDVQKGMRVHLHCVVVKGDFPISLQWLKDGKIIPYRLSVAERTIDEYSSTLTINKVTEEHRGNYTCIAGNAVANTSHTTQLIVNVPPTWLHEPEDINVLMGDTLLIPCAADGSPKPVILWRKESDNSESSSQNHIFQAANYKVLNNGSLWIENVLPEDKGYYSCEAKNEIGMALNKIIYVTVHVPARFSTSLQNVTVAKGGTAAIDCVARGDKPITVKWFHGGDLFEAHNHPRADVSEESLEFGIHSRITLKNVLRNDTSAFLCHADNQYGNDQSEIWVIVQEVPEPPGNLHVLNFSSRAVNLTWEQPYSGNSQITVYTIQHKHKLVAWEKNVSQMTVPGDQTFASITGLQPANSYHFRVTARNSLGSSNASDTITVTTAEEAPGEAPQEIRVRAVSSESLHVSWKPPRDQYQHGEIIGYYIGYRTSNSSEPFHYKTYEVLPGAELRILLTGLQKFTEYVIFVQAYNSAGAGPQSLGVSVFTEEDVPELPPGNLKCTSTSSQSILVTWLPIAADDINGILLGYKILYNTVSDWDEVSAPVESSTEECRLELMGLQKYCNYSIEVKGYTRMGDGIASRPVFCRTQEDVPDKPDDIKALVVNAETLLISWLKPKFPNGVIKKYIVYVRSLDGGTLLREEYEIPPTQTHYILSHLIAHHRYELWVTAATVVGESDASLHVVQIPTEQVPARIASFGTHMMAARGEQLALPCITVGQPHPSTIWSKGGQLIQENNRIHINAEWTLHISSVETSDTGNYSCRVQNILGADEITYTVTVKNRRNNGSPLPPTDFRVSSATETSLSLKWSAPDDSIYAAEGYTLYFKREFGEWEKVIVQAEDKNFTLGNLQCGSKYQLYLQAFNHMGNSSPTKNITAYTQGKAPIAPTKEDLLATNSTFIQLNVGTWNTGGCPITTLVVEYKLKTGTKWILVSNNLKYTEEKFSILDLNPVTNYELRMTAHNSAGSTVVTYDFTTLSSTGAVVQPELIMWGNYRRKYFYKDPGVIIPVAVITLIGVTFGIGMFLYVKRKKRSHTDSKSEGENIADPHVQSEDKVGYGTADVSQDQKLHQTSSASDTTARVNPYATFRLTDEEKLKAIINDYESCSEYWKVNKNPDSENEGVDWIPLHSLYQAHRY